MKKIFYVIALITVFGFISLSTVSCKKATGGGWLASSPDGLQKATFGFIARCEDDENGVGMVTVKLQYNDHESNVRFHGVGEVEVMDGLSCADLDEMYPPNEFVAVGVYRPQPKSKLGNDVGSFELHVVDNGEPGISAGDTLEIHISDGPYIGYSNVGPLGGGNIQVFE